MIVGGGGILLLWAVLPSYLLRHFREDAFRTEVTVSSESVAPYGVQYADLKNRMKRSVEVLNNATLYQERMKKRVELTEEERVMVEKGDALLASFITTLGMMEEEELPALWSDQAVLHFFGSDASDCTLALIQHDQWYLFYDPWDGIPVSGGMARSGKERPESWESLLKAYENAMGIPFSSVSVETESMIVDHEAEGKGYSIVTRGGLGNGEVQCVGKSADGAFLIQARFGEDPFGDPIFSFRTYLGEQ